MNPRTSTLRGTAFQALDPWSGRVEMEVLLPKRLIDWAHRRGKGALYELDQSLGHVLLKPAAVFCGVMRDNDDDRGQTDGWLCYCGVPDVRFDYETGESSVPTDRVYLVFLNREKEVYNHRWEEADIATPTHPSDLKGRFKEQLL